MAPGRKIIYGEKGLKWVKWLGEPRDFRGCVTGLLYAFPEQHRAKGVDLRDLPEMVKDGGRENWEDIEGKKLILKEPKPERPAPKPSEEPKAKKPPAEPAPVLEEEVVDG